MSKFKIGTNTGSPYDTCRRDAAIFEGDKLIAAFPDAEQAARIVALLNEGEALRNTLIAIAAAPASKEE